MKNMIKDALILFLITVISGALLGIVYEVTKDPIAEQQAKAKQEACKNVFADADSFESLGGEETAFDSMTSAVKEKGLDADVNEIVKALDGSGALLGYVITVTDHEGYGGDIQFSMGVQKDGTLNGISLLSISETAGLGMRADEVLVPQFAGKKVSGFEYSKTGATAENQIDAISGATITTNAVTNGVNAGLYVFENYLQTEGGADNE